jgi:acetylornithine deacetylase
MQQRNRRAAAALDTISNVTKHVEKERSKMLAFAKGLIEVQSISCTPQEGEVQNIVIGELKKIPGLKLDIWSPKSEDLGRYPLHPVRNGPWSYEGRPNVVGVLKGVGGGRSLILNGHIDVVSAEPVTGWKESPWAGNRVDGKMYGRGSMDMKGGMAAMIFALRAIVLSGVRLKGDVILESMVEEEYGGGGTVGAVVRGYTADAAIIAESTMSDSVCIASGGSRFFNIKIMGKPEWPHLAHHGVNAIELASQVYHELIQFDEDRRERLHGRHPLLETEKAGGNRGPGRPVNITVGVLTAGDWPATVAGWAEMKGRLGLAPSEKGNEVQAEMEQRLSALAERDPWMKEHPPVVEWWGARREGYELSPSEAIIKTIERNIKSEIGKCTIYGNSSASDAAYLVPRVGKFGGIPTILYGPGGDGAHAFDEYVLTEDIVKVAKVLARTILDWCGWEESR